MTSLGRLTASRFVETSFLLLLLLGHCALEPVGAQETAQSRHEQALRHLTNTAVTLSSRSLEEFNSAREWESNRRILAHQLQYMLGLDPLPARTPLNAQLTSRLHREEYEVHGVVFESSPGLYVTGNFYVPNPTPRQAPAILYLCGHSAHPQGAKTQYQNRVQWYARQGYCVLILDTLEFGEVPGVHHGTHNLNQWHWLSLGYTPAGTEVWNAMRALDWLSTRPEVDKARIGCTGISGGGATTWYLAALDTRVAVAAPSCSTFTYGSQASHGLASGQCDCIYYHNCFGIDFPVLAGLIAPRPLLITSGQKDTIFPPDGYHEVYRRGKKIYRLLGQGMEERIREVDADVGHSDPPLFLNASRQWMNQWLKGDARPVKEDMTVQLEEPSALSALTKLPVRAANYSIQDQLTQPHKPQLTQSHAAWRQRAKEVDAHLREHVFGWFPTQPIPFESRKLSGSGGWASTYGAYQDFSFQTEPGVRIRAQWIAPRAGAERASVLIRVEQAGDSLYASDFDDLLPLLGRVNVVVLNPRFTETDMNSKERTDVERMSAWVGRTQAAMQVWDMLRAVDWIFRDLRLQPSRLVVSARGDMAALSVYAAYYEPRITELVLNQPTSSHWSGPALMNVLRGTDVAEVAGLLAPRPLTFVSEAPASFELTRSAYRWGKASGAITRSPSVAEVMLR